MARDQVAILISGRGSNMAALIAAAKDPAFPAHIALVVSNRPDATGLAIAQREGVKTLVLDHKPYGKDRAAFEKDLQSVLDQHDIALVCLAGFMRLFTEGFIRRWEGRMLNIHPALLPSFKGLDPHGQALRAGVKLHGATVHFVTLEMDSGPIVAQVAVPVQEDDTAETLATRVLAAEHRIYPLALKLVCEQRVRIEDGRCIISGTAPAQASLVSPHLST